MSANPETRHRIIKEAFAKTNTELSNRSFDVTFSGSTCVTVMLFGDHLICANVGDSRAVLASYKDHGISQVSIYQLSS
jgi:serine/threonine protein phosphatase PrpC